MFIIKLMNNSLGQHVIKTKTYLNHMYTSVNPNTVQLDEKENFIKSQ